MWQMHMRPQQKLALTLHSSAVSILIMHSVRALLAKTQCHNPAKPQMHHKKKQKLRGKGQYDHKMKLEGRMACALESAQQLFLYAISLTLTSNRRKCHNTKPRQSALVVSAGLKDTL